MLGREVAFRISRDGADYLVEAATAGWPLEPAAPGAPARRYGSMVRAGLYACSPKDAGFEASFAGLTLADPQAEVQPLGSDLPWICAISASSPCAATTEFELAAVGDDQAHALDRDVDQPIAAVGLAHAPVDAHRLRSGRQRDLGRQQRVTLVDHGAATEQRETHAAAELREAVGQAVERVDAERIEVGGALCLAGAAPMAPEHEPGDQRHVGDVEQQRRSCRGAGRRRRHRAR